jgi:Tol biopolymer transport system component/predicted Ser/Thr protein kinase
VHAGDTLGHYRIIHTLGKGGMGEVYAADDTKLHRTVALKILPAVFATDESFRARFEREAQAVAALNHPNIVTIYSVEEDAGRPFIAMEYVEGRPLSENITRGGLSLDRILRIGIEVADAMAAAQQRGITHRDLKPANIMIAADGRAKILDFGLAKVRDAELAQAGEQVTQMSRDLTGEGRILGTVAYMSPEQAEGKPVDPRSDIFSFGVVLHEMATGERPFKGDSNVSILSSIIKDTPKPITESNPALPADLARIVRRCLAKDPSRRYQTAADLRNELEELKQDSGSSVAIAVPRSPGVTRSRLAWMGVPLAGLAVAVAALFLVNREGRGLAPPAPGFTTDRIQRLTTTGTAYIAAISADGRYVVHAKVENSGTSLWTRQTATTSDVRIVPPAAGNYKGINLSADGNYVYYSQYTFGSGVASLYRVPVLGGAPTKILDDIDSPIAFSPDQKRFAFTRGVMSRGATDLVVADANGASVNVLATSTAPVQFQLEGPAWSPDGHTFLVVATSSHPGAPALVEAVDAQRGTTQVIGAPWAILRAVAWLPDGKSFLVTGLDLGGSSTQIWRVSYPSGERSRVTNDLNEYTGVSVSSDGRSIATVQTETQAGIYVANGPDKEPRRITGAAGRAEGTAGLAWMPDGRIVYTSTASGLPQIWIVDSDGANARQVTSQKTLAADPQVSPDGAWIYFASYESDSWAIFRIAPDGTGVQRAAAMPDEPGDGQLLPLSPDGKAIYFVSTKTGTPLLMRISTSGGVAEQVSKTFFHATDVSPDGTHACGWTWDAVRRRSVFTVLDLATGALEVQPPLNGRPAGARFAFYVSGGELATLAQIAGKWMVRVSPAAGGALTPVTPPSDDQLFAGAASRDGRIAFSRGQRISDVVLISTK